MVGVPGKSLGCYTCRRRKIRCDMAKPHCLHCLNSGRNCEGYARKTVWLNRTANGLMVRQPPEEPIIPGNAEHLALGSAMPPSLQQTKAIRDRIEGMFLEKYLASSSTAAYPTPGTYVLEVITTLPRVWVLEPAIQALCITKIGRIEKEPRLIQHGHQAYVLALKRLHYAVSKPEYASDDATLATAKILNLRELYEPSLDSVNGLYSHTAGLTSILLTRGTQLAAPTQATRLILEASRYNAMIACIQKRQHSPLLAKADWWTDASIDTITSFEQRLYTIGFDIGNFLDDLEQFKLQREDLSVSGYNLASKSVAIDSSLLSWYKSFQLWAQKPLYRTDHDDHLVFPHITVAHIHLDYWSLRIVLNTIVEKLSALLLAHNIPQQDGPIAFDIRKVHQWAQKSLEESHKLGQNIASSIAYCRRPDMGYVGPQRAMFGCCISLSFYRRQPDSQNKVRQVIDTMRELNRQNGLHFADDMQDATLPDWASDMQP